MNKSLIFVILALGLISCGKDDEKATDNRLFGQDPVAFYNQFASSFSGQGFSSGTPLFSHSLRVNNEVERDMGPNSRIL